MSTRAGISYHHDPETKVTVYIYEELVALDTDAGIRIEIEHPCGVTNVAWSSAFSLPREKAEDAVTAKTVEPDQTS